MQKYYYSLFLRFKILTGIFLPMSIVVLPLHILYAAKQLKPRVLVIPFDNMMGNKNYDWMNESISDNLKENLIKSNRFDVMDVQLLKQINPDIKFNDLTGNEATALARKLNCEAAIIGRYITKAKGDMVNALIQVEAVNTVSNESIVIKSEYADIDGAIFERVQNLAKAVADEFVAKLPPVSSSKNTRSSDLEKRIFRLEHPPKGFFDTLVFQAPGLDEKQLKKVRFKPAFDIDTFEYNLYLPEGVKQLEYKYDIWGKSFTPDIKIGIESCSTKSCEIKNDESEIVISRTNDKVAAINNNKSTQISETSSAIYKIKVHRQPLSGPLLGRLWLNAGYPYMKTLSFKDNKSPSALQPDGDFPFDPMSGVLSIEAGIAPGKWQLPGGINWSLVTQLQYAKGNIPLNSADSSIKAAITMYSTGGGIRIERPVLMGNIYGISPMIGFNAHYQIFSHSASRSAFNLTGLNPEVGLIQFVKLGKNSKYRVSLSSIAGSYLYKKQNFSYIRTNLGVEYAYK